MKVLNKNVSDITEEIRLRFFPRELIMLSDNNAFKYLIKQALMILNKYGYYSRFINVKVNDYVIDLNTVNYPVGINGANCVFKLYSINDFSSAFAMYNMLLGNMPFHYIVTNNNDLFLEYLYASKLVDDLRYRYRNMANFVVIDNKVLLDKRVYKGLGDEFVMEYSARFDVDGDRWSFFDIEYTFLIDLLEALVMYREGLAQSELSFAGDLAGNYSTYLDMGNEKLKEIIDNFVSAAIKSKSVRVR